jgi:hypothetical protein
VLRATGLAGGGLAVRALGVAMARYMPSAIRECGFYAGKLTRPKHSFGSKGA